MAFSRNGICRAEQSKSILEMTLDPTAAFGGIGKASALKRSEHQVMNY